MPRHLPLVARLGLLLLLPAEGALFRSPVRTTVSDSGGVVHINLVPDFGRDGVLHLRLVGGRISRRAAKRSIAATTRAIHACSTCTVVVDMGSCRGVSPLALPVTAKFLLSHPELKQILIIEAKGAVKLACITVRRLSGHDKLDLFQSFDAFEAACTSGRAGARRRAALQVARSLRVREPLFGGLRRGVRELLDAATARLQ